MYGSLWKCIKVNGNVWMNRKKLFWKFAEGYGSVLKCLTMAEYGSVRHCMEVYESILKCMGVYGSV